MTFFLFEAVCPRSVIAVRLRITASAIVCAVLFFASAAHADTTSATAARFTAQPVARTAIKTERAVAWWGFSAGALAVSYKQAQDAWGSSNGKFHFKSDWGADHLALSDEVSHTFVAYKLVGVINGGNRWVGIERRRALKLAAGQALLLTFIAEFPIDAFNPTQGFGISDFLFNAAGVAVGYHRAAVWDRTGVAPRWDFKASVKRSFFDGTARLIAHTHKQYDDYVYWLTVRPSRRRALPVLVGLGYSSAHRGRWPDEHTQAEFHFGVGTSLEELAGAIDPRLGEWFRPLGFYFLNVGVSVKVE